MALTEKQVRNQQTSEPGPSETFVQSDASMEQVAATQQLQREAQDQILAGWHDGIGGKP